MNGTERQGREIPAKRFLRTLERISLAVEKPIARLVHDPRFNPLYHTGTITIFLLLVILGTGVYLTMFYQFGFAGSYRAITNIEASLVGRVIRALHRYASDLAVILVLLHAWRTFFMDRFRGPRWLAWVTGIGLAAVAWLIGITGYWLISDTRAQLLNEALVRLLGSVRAGADFLRGFLATGTRGAGWRLTFVMMALHLGLSAVVGLVYWYHIRRLSRPKWLPPRFWLVLAGVPLLLAAVLVPLGMLPPLDPLRLPGPVNLDAFYLFLLPAALRRPPVLLGGGLIALLALSAAIPWLLARPKTQPVAVNAERCTGCTLCAADCPYKAITMTPREEGAAHKYLAQVNPKLCVGCGVCIGACDPLALSLRSGPVEWLWDEVIARAGARAEGKSVKLIFTCERHWAQRPAELRSQVAVIPLACVGMVLPDLVERGLAAGAAEVQIVGCPPEDCANREGNLWVQRRLERARLPKLSRMYVDAPITTDWLPPNDFGRAQGARRHRTAATSYDLKPGRAHLRSIAAAVGVMLAVLAVTVVLSRVPFAPYPASGGVVEIALKHLAGQPVKSEATGEIVVPAADAAQGPVRLVLEVDGQVVWGETYAGGAAAEAFEQIALPPGAQRMRLLLYDTPGQTEPHVLSDRAVGLAAGQILPLRFSDAHVGGDPEAGRRLFARNASGVNTGCRICHSLEPDVRLVGPSLAGVGTRAAARVPGMSAQEYLLQSIVDPDAYVVEGYPKGQMVRDTAQRLTEEQLQDLVAFLLTLR
jgi:ferredoxin/cytochrome c551/c552